MRRSRDRRDGSRAPGYDRPIATEIERKFLITDPAAAVEHAADSRQIEQGYVAIDPDGTEVRVRRSGDERTLTVKHGSGESRFEQEVELDPKTFDSLWPLTAGRRITKRRSRVKTGGHVFEIDVYEHPLSGLAVVEVEFDSETESAGFRPPGWFGRELTGDARYSNASLAVVGAPDPAA